MGARAPEFGGMAGSMVDKRRPGTQHDPGASGGGVFGQMGQQAGGGGGGRAQTSNQQDPGWGAGSRAQTAGQKTARAKFTEMKSRFANVRKRNLAVANALSQVSMIDGVDNQ